MLRQRDPLFSVLTCMVAFAYEILLVEGLFSPMPLVLCSEHYVVPKNLGMQLFFMGFGGGAN